MAEQPQPTNFCKLCRKAYNKIFTPCCVCDLAVCIACWNDRRIQTQAAVPELVVLAITCGNKQCAMAADAAARLAWYA